MTRRLFFLMPGLVRLTLARSAAVDDFVVIVHKSNHFDSISRSKLGYLFQRKISRWPWGAEVMPIEPADAVLLKGFAETVLHTTPEALAVYWIDQKATRSVDPPLRAPNVQAAIESVATRPGAIAYIPSPSTLDERIKVLRLE